MTDFFGCMVILCSKGNSESSDENNKEDNCITWEEIKSFHKNPPRYRLHRNQKMKEKYDKHIKNIKDRNIDLNNYISDKYFNKDDKNNNPDWVFVVNSFPYNLEKGIKHYLIWLNPDKVNPDKLNSDIENIVDIDKIIIDNIGNTEYYYFENLCCNKSVNKVKHFQVFFK